MKNTHIFFIVIEDHIEHLGLMYLSSALKRHGFSTSLLRADYRTIAKALKHRMGERTLVCYSPTYFSVQYYLDLNRAIQEKFNVHAVWGGQYVTSKPELILEEGVDAVCIGEGDYSFLEYVQAVCEGRPATGIQGIWVKKDGQIYRNPVRAPIRDLDALPFPDRDLINRKGKFYYGVAYVITSRGCSYACPHCYHGSYKNLYGHSNPYRRRSVDHVIHEITLIQRRQPLTNIVFYDDLFICMPQWLEEFSEKFRRQIGVPFRCNGRIEDMNPSVLKTLKEAGCRTISLGGVETSDDRVREHILKRRISTESIVDAAQMIRDAGIVVRMYNMIGLPGGSLASDLDLLRLNVRCQCLYSAATVFTAYPGTDFYSSNRLKKGDAVPKAGFLQKILGSSKAPWALLRQRYKLYVPDFGFSSIVERKGIMNLVELFPLIVRFPALLPYARFILRLPLGRLYRFIHEKSEYVIRLLTLYSEGTRKS